VFLSSLGGGLVDGDRVHVRVDVGPGAFALLGTQASTKVYRSPRGCTQRVEARVEDGASLVLLPDPVVCFAGARYGQEIDVSLALGASLVMLDGYTCGRAASGERWQFSRYASRVRVDRGGRRAFVDATRLDPAEGPLAARMGDLDVVLSLMALGPKFGELRAAMLADPPARSPADRAVVAASPIGADGAIVRIAAENHEKASQMLRPSFIALARALGDDPFARKW
jgi:urease accessory protein